MRTCPACRQHIFAAEVRCPFCDAPVGVTTAPPVAMTLGLAAVMAACGPGLGGGDSDETTTSGGAESSTSVDSVTTETTTTTATSTTGTASMASTGADSSGDSTDTEMTTLTFVEFDGGGGVYGSACDLWAQDCPEGEKCMPWSNDGSGIWNATRCSPVADEPGQPGQPCIVEGGPTSGIDDCDWGLVCFHVDPKTNEGSCVALCVGDESAPSCDDPTRVCSVNNDGDLPLCLLPCDPLASDCPDEGSCVAGGSDEFVCVRPGAMGLGDSCEQLIDCTAGLSCVEGATPGCADSCCTEACDPVGSMCSFDEQTCEPLSAAGVCDIP